MIKKLLGAAAALALTAGLAAAEGKTFYWVSHGGPADPVWTYFLQGAEAYAKTSGNTVNTSFHSGDVPSQQEAVRAAIAAGPTASAPPAPTPVRWSTWWPRPGQRASRSSTSTPRIRRRTGTPMWGAT